MLENLDITLEVIDRGTYLTIQVEDVTENQREWIEYGQAMQIIGVHVPLVKVPQARKNWYVSNFIFWI